MKPRHKDFRARLPSGETVTNGDWVHVDGDKHMKMVVTAVCFRRDNVECQISWLCNGDAKTAWIELWRMTAVAQ